MGKVLFGIHTPKPIKGFPPGQTRIRMRANSFVWVFVRSPGGGIRKFAVNDQDGFWQPCHEQAANYPVPAFDPGEPVSCIGLLDDPLACRALQAVLDWLIRGAGSKRAPRQLLGAAHYVRSYSRRAKEKTDGA